MHEIHWTLLLAGLANVAVLTVCIALARPLRHVAIPPVRTYWYDLALRAAMVAALVGVTVSLSFRIGPGGSGILAVFPIILISVMLILHRRVGGKPTAAVMANAVLGLVGFAFACVVLHFAATRLRLGHRPLAGVGDLGRLGPHGLDRAPARLRAVRTATSSPSAPAFPSAGRALPSPRAATCRRD